MTRVLEVLSEGPIVGFGSAHICIWRGEKIVNIRLEELKPTDKYASIGDVADYRDRTGIDPLTT